jgi:hypothetical protein
LCHFHSKTNKELQADWKRRNPEKAKEQNRGKNKTYRGRLNASLTQEEKIELKRKNTERRRASRQKKKQETALVPEPTTLRSELRK